MPSSPIPGTIILYGPVYQRSGFGGLARVWTQAFHQAGLRVKVVPVDCDDQSQAGGLDDCDMRLLRSLEYTPVVGQVTAIYAYQPIYVWPRMKIEEPHVRIMLTTFDSSAAAASPPYRQIFICNQMDQTWLANATEAAAWARAGLDPQRTKAFNWPHDWIENPRLGPLEPPVRSGDRRFRFLHVSCFLPRRRLDVLLRAFFQEYRDDRTAELYLKMSFPGWHPVRGKPRQDFFAMLENLRRETGSSASVIVDEALGTRLELAGLIDSCDAYVSTDTTMTAPVAEALIRKRPTIITDGWGVELPEKEMIVIPNAAHTIPLTPEMAEYMPHQRGKAFQALEISEVQNALRTVFSLPTQEMQARTQAAYEFMRSTYSLEATLPPAIAALTELWERKRSEPSGRSSIEIVSNDSSGLPKREQPTHSLYWGGLQLFHGKIPTANREICLELLGRGHSLSLVPANGPFQIEELELSSDPEFKRLAERFYHPIGNEAEFGVSCRWHPGFQEGRARRYVLCNTWWSGAIPADWPRQIEQQVDEVWVPSEHVRQNFLLGGVAPEKVQVIPFGVNPRVFRRQSEPFPLKTRKSFRFLFVGETSLRKGFDSVLRAYASAFKAKDDVCLVVKDVNCEDYYGRLVGRGPIAEFIRKAGLPEIEYLDQMYDATAMARLYSSCHCLVQPFRTASNGQSVLEAMACGLPVIATRYGGLLDFCNDENALLLDAVESRRKQTHVGHWRVDGPQRHAEIQLPQLVEQMRQVFAGSTRVTECAQRAAALVTSQFTWGKTVDKIEGRLQAISQTPMRTMQSPAASHTTGQAAAGHHPSVASPTPGTLLLVAPFRNRSGYGVAARALATTLHSVGVRLKCVSVDGEEPGIDDCDMALLKQLENAPLTAPVAAVFFHVASPNWLKVELPPGSKRILYTTFDSSAQGNTPPPEWIQTCNAVDQLWLMTDREGEVFIRGGVQAAKVRVLPCPHHWIPNAALPLPQPAKLVCEESGRFRFLSVAMYLPRRRWDTLIEAFLTEFSGDETVELYLKVNFPSWHPVPGQPKRDLLELIEKLRVKTGSSARIVVDDALGTRRQICGLVDSCQVYVSTDTSITAPVGEAFARARVVVLPDGLGAKLPLCGSAFVIPADPAAQRPITEAELQYQPHHRGQMMPLLGVEDLRHAMRASFAIPLDQRQNMGAAAAVFMECTYGGAALAPRFIKVVRELWSDVATRPNGPSSEVQHRPTVAWQGSFLDHGSLSHVNRELTRALLNYKDITLNRISTASPASPAFDTLAREISTTSAGETDVTVRHAWPPDWSRPKTGKLVVIQPWEFGVLPRDWVDRAKTVDEFWVPSEYVRRVYVDSGVPAEKVKVVPNGVDPEKFHPQVPPMQLATQKKFKFLFVGGTIFRKGPDVLLKAYLDNFTAADDVCLVIKDFGGKSVYAGQTFESQIRAAQSRPNAPEILYLNEELPPDSLPGLYAACDTLVLPYRGEGFGLPVIEAMASALPVIVTAGGATDDFVRDDFAWRIPATRMSLGDEVGGLKLVRPGWLLEPDVAVLGRQLREAFGNPADTRRRGQLAAAHAHQLFSWKNSAAIAAQRIRELAKAATAPAAAKPTPAAKAKIVLPPCALVGNLAEGRDLLKKKKLEAAWTATVAAMAARPFHPEAALLLAEIAQAVGDSVSARQCAQHARNLAPDWKPAKQFLKGNVRGNSKPAWLTLPPAIAAVGQKPRLSVCLIVKNEEKFLEQCLASVRGLAAQMVVVDTGSTDRTVEIAEAAGAEVHHFAWTDDFSAARNEALKFATGDWILSLDADEELVAEHRETLLQEIQAAGALAYRLPIIDQGREREGCSYVPRLFRNAPGIFFLGRVHEQALSSLEVRRREWGLENRLGHATLLHHGYVKEVVAGRNKIERNLRLLELAIDELPGEPNLLMNLGLELIRSGRHDAGLTRYREALEAMAALPAAQIVPELRETLLTQYSTHLLTARRFVEITQLWLTPLAKSCPLTASQHFVLGLAQLELRQPAEAIEQLRQCLAKRGRPSLSPANPEIFGAGPSHCLALALAVQKENDAAAAAFREALVDDPKSRAARFDFARFLFERNEPLEALKWLTELASEPPQDAPVWQFGAQIALSRPQFLSFACDWTGESMKHFPHHPAIATHRAEALLFSQQTDAALALWSGGVVPTSSRQLAAVVICENAGGNWRRRLSAADELPVSQELLKWCLALMAFGAKGLVDSLGENLENLRAIVPSFVKAWEAAVKAPEPVPA